MRFLKKFLISFAIFYLCLFFLALVGTFIGRGKNNNMTLFDVEKEFTEYSSYKVIKVIKDGNALAEGQERGIHGGITPLHFAILLSLT